LPPSAPWLPTALIEKSHRQIKTNINSCRSKKSALLIHSVQHTSNKTKVPNQSSAILKRPQKSGTIFLYLDWLNFASLVNHNTVNSSRIVELGLRETCILKIENH